MVERDLLELFLYDEGEIVSSVWKALPPPLFGLCSHMWIRGPELLKSVKLWWCQSLENSALWVNRFREKTKTPMHWSLTINVYSCGKSLWFVFTPFKKEAVFGGVLLQQHWGLY